MRSSRQMSAKEREEGRGVGARGSWITLTGPCGGCPTQPPVRSAAESPPVWSSCHHVPLRGCCREDAAQEQAAGVLDKEHQALRRGFGRCWGSARAHHVFLDLRVCPVRPRVVRCHLLRHPRPPLLDLLCDSGGGRWQGSQMPGVGFGAQRCGVRSGLFLFYLRC